MNNWSTSARRMVRSRKMSRKSLPAMARLRRKSDHLQVVVHVDRDGDGDPDQYGPSSSLGGVRGDGRRHDVKEKGRKHEEGRRRDPVVRQKGLAERDELESDDAEEQS